MQYIDYLKLLNEDQLKAVTSASQFLRIVAGAGSGKTRVLTYRIAYLLSQYHVDPEKILGITFTNKVALEMKNRIADLVPEVGYRIKIKTFHSFAAMLLRSEIHHLDYPNSFTILDDDDTTKMIKDICSTMGYRKSDSFVKKAISFIGYQKLKGKYPEDIKEIRSNNPEDKLCLEVYEEYENKKAMMLSLDFDDLLLFAIKILKSFPSVRMKWQDKIDYILVDEFQDTNDVEFTLLQLLIKDTTFLTIVGDPDQTIYTWRGANQNIILDIGKHFSNVETIVLERNYRSTQNILDSANKLIVNNKFRVPKNLYTKSLKGDKIVTKKCSSKQSEADYVASEIKRLHEVENYPYSEIAILYRSAYVTLEFESSLTSRNIPYRIYGGMKFYQRKEIKDLLAYFRLIVNKKDDVSFERIVNVPRRGIGETSINCLKNEAKDFGLSLFEYVEGLDESQSSLSKKVITSLKTLVALINLTRDNINKDEEAISKTLEDLITSINYFDYLRQDDDGDDRIENVKALFADFRHFIVTNPESTFSNFLENIALVSAQDEIVDGDFVNMMTVHTAKGLEFPIVFVVRFNENVFPHVRAVLESGYQGLEEERRLAYVAFTRAMKKLYITYSSGYDYVSNGNLLPSRFIKESGNMTSTLRSDGDYYSPSNNRSYSFYNNNERSGYTPHEESTSIFSQVSDNGINDWKVGDKVIHKTLGKGVVTKVDGDNIIVVYFEEHGEKTLLGSHPSLQRG